MGAGLVHWKEPEYPQNLLQIYDPPVILYVRGDATVLNSPALSIVGNAAADGIWNADGGTHGA